MSRALAVTLSSCLCAAACTPGAPPPAPRYVGPGAPGDAVDEVCEVRSPVPSLPSVTFDLPVPPVGCGAQTRQWSISLPVFVGGPAPQTEQLRFDLEQTAHAAGSQCTVEVRAVAYRLKAGQRVALEPFEADVWLCAVRIESAFADQLQPSTAVLDELSAGPEQVPTVLAPDEPGALLPITRPAPGTCPPRYDGAAVHVPGFDHGYTLRYTMPTADLDRLVLDGSVRVAWRVRVPD